MIPAAQAAAARGEQRPELSTSAAALLDDAGREGGAAEWNDAPSPVVDDLCVHTAIELQVAKTPDAVAVVTGGEALSYRELDLRANRLARRLVCLGAGPDRIVGLFIERSLDMMVALLAILKAGAAYLPLDPRYPRERLEFMIADAEPVFLLTHSSLLPRLPANGKAVVCVDAGEAAEDGATEGIADAVTPDHLAYVIYTSGSTGRPKGVMVSHRNVGNFFAGMDARLPHTPPGVWLAVTSLSFDISVLELFWTLARGFRVIVHRDDGFAAEPLAGTAARPIEFSLFYFASDESADAADKYRLLLEGAKFADRNGFAAVWSPERHFHAFGGLYPNPSVASAAIAAVTERIKIRAGSCVLPLHSPIRVAEEWALVDNLSRGRVGISFASGWQPNDFVIAPRNFADRKEAMYRGVDIVRRLWRGEAIRFPGPDGQDVDVRTLPRPLQPELPVWITTAGNPETFRQAGEAGANLLTHLLGQSVEELGEKLAAYRRAWRVSGHTGEGCITLMLHCFVGENDDAVREIVRAPMKQYLRSSVDLIRRAAWSFPPFVRRSAATGQSPAQLFDAQDLSETETEALLDHAFERYFATSGLFGTPQTCLGMIERLRAIGVDEVACLIDFGVEPQRVLAHLEHLKSLQDLAVDEAAGDARTGILDAIRAQGVTHLQCTPSLARMLLADERQRDALGQLRALLIGGEAFPPALAEQLRPLLAGELLNMYGPTETTIWSTTHRVTAAETSVPIGQPIVNTRVHVLDENRHPVPSGEPGELYIGGAGVARGYLRRPELTRERFVSDPFGDAQRDRLYRTGDLVRHRGDGALEFLGRLDQQVKIRGHRVELGEIETVLCRDPGIREAVVVARDEEPGLKRLAAYVTAAPGADVAPDRLRAAVRAALPEFMVPAHVVVLDRMPVTPNGKVDRAALPMPQLAAAPGDAAADRSAAAAPPEDALEETIGAIWQAALGRPHVGRTQSFFEIGGDSLLAVAVHRHLCDRLQRELPVTDIFRFPTIAGLARQFRSARVAPAAPAWSPLVPFAAEVDGVPLFLIHGLTGEVTNLRSLARRLTAARPVYAVQARGLNGAEPPADRIEAMATYYLEHIRRVQPRGPYQIAGFCFGGLVAFEMARQLSAASESVAFLGLLDSGYDPRFLATAGRLRIALAKLRVHAEILHRLPAPARLAYLRARLGKRLPWMAGADAPATAATAALAELPAGSEAPAELRAVTAAAAQASYFYEPGAYAGRLTYFRPQIRDFRNLLNFASEWRRKAAGGVDTVVVPGDHMTMLDPPAVDILAARLNTALGGAGGA